MISFGGERGVIGNMGLRFIKPAPVVSTALSWIYKWDFGTPEAAPLASPHAIDVGPNLTLTQTTGQFSISPAGQLNFPTGAINGLGWISGAITRAAGYALIDRAVTLSTVANAGSSLWKENANIQGNAAGGNRYGLITLAAGLSIADTASATAVVADATSTSTAYHLASILRSTGVIYAIKGGVFANWHVPFVSNSSIASTLYAIFANVGAVGSKTRWGVADLVGSGYSVFNGDNGLAQVYTSAPAQGGTGNIDANGTHYFKVTALPTNTGDAISYIFRKQDANNYWRVTLTKDAGATCTISLDEVVAGVSTQRGSSASTVAANDWIGILPYSTTIRVVEGAAGGTQTTRITYASASNFSTQTAYEWQTIPTGATIADHSGYPEYLSGSAATALDACLT